MATALEPTEKRFIYAEPVSDELFLSVADQNGDWRAELDGPYTVVLMPPHGFDSSALNTKLIALVYNWNATLAEPGVVFDSDTRFRGPEGSLKGPDTAWISAPRYCELEAAGKAFGDIVPEIIVELRSKTDRWPAQVARCEAWVTMGALYAIAIDPQEHRVEHRSTGTHGYREQFEAVLAIAHIIAGP